MVRVGGVLFAAILLACNNQTDVVETEDDGLFNYKRFNNAFSEAALPYQLADSVLLMKRDTISLKTLAFSGFTPDTTTSKLFGKNGVKYYRLAKISAPKAETYYVIRAESGKKKSALIAVFDKDGKFVTSFPFLLPDSDQTTTQVSTIDKSFSVSRAIVQTLPYDVVAEGKDVYAFNSDTRQFVLIMTDVLDDNTIELINPIDTFSRTHKFAGDYVKNKKNIVSIRDGRYPNELRFFIHFEKDKGECVGELKGTALIASSNSAMYRQGGDPCVLELQFGTSTVTLKETEGCGNHRGLKCLFDGSFSKKKQSSGGQN
ncbi:MAG: hypothetical protein ABR502_00545 [Chitinophagaceae bacterium]